MTEHKIKVTYRQDAYSQTPEVKKSLTRRGVLGLIRKSIKEAKATKEGLQSGTLVKRESEDFEDYHAKMMFVKMTDLNGEPLLYVDISVDGYAKDKWRKPDFKIFWRASILIDEKDWVYSTNRSKVEEDLSKVFPVNSYGHHNI